MKKILIGTLAVCSLAASSMALQFDVLSTRFAAGTTADQLSATLNFTIDGTPTGLRPATLVAGPDGSPLKFHFVFNYDAEFLPLMDCDTGPCADVQFGPTLTVTACGTQSATRAVSGAYESVVAFPRNLPSNFGPGNQPFGPCVTCLPSCSVSATNLLLVATNANHNPTGTFSIINTSTGCPANVVNISGSVSESCPNFDVTPATYALVPGASQVFTVTYHGDGQPGGTEVCDILTGCGAVVVTGDDQVAALETPAVFSLAEAFPNPFNPSTTIAYSVPETQKVTLNVFNTNGQLVQTLVNGMVERGEHKVVFDASNLSSGVYVYSLQAGTQSSLKKMVLVK